jgi:hypothetical protein
VILSKSPIIQFRDVDSVLGHELAELQPVSVPIFRLFEWSSENSPQEGISDVLSSQLGGRVPCDPLKKSPAQIEAIAPSADQMRANFESLVLVTTTNPTKSPAAPFEESAPTARDRYVCCLPMLLEPT